MEQRLIEQNSDETVPVPKWKNWIDRYVANAPGPFQRISAVYGKRPVDASPSYEMLWTTSLIQLKVGKNFLMKRSVRWFLSLLIVLLWNCYPNKANGQGMPIPLQRVVFKDKVLHGNINGFISRTREKVISVAVEQRDNAYLYKLSGIHTFDYVEKYATESWGQWHGRIVIFYSGPELKDVCTISDTTILANLLKYVRPLFSNESIAEIRSKNYKPDPSIPAEGLEWTFKVENGREIWLWGNDGYDSRDILEVPVPN